MNFKDVECEDVEFPLPQEGDPCMEEDRSWRILEAAGYKEFRGIIYHPKTNNKPTAAEWDAIAYLCDEWDYDYSPAPI